MKFFVRTVLRVIVMTIAVNLLFACSHGRHRLAEKAKTEKSASVMVQRKPPIRFLLTFDDGPSIREPFNPTRLVLETLAENDIQPGIKAIFFIQTRASNGGGTLQGRELIQREYAEGQVLGFHTATPGHSNHVSLNPVAFESSLQSGIQDHLDIVGVAPTLVRPPMWRYDMRTLETYRRHGMHMVMTDVSANDGKIGWPNFSPRRRGHILRQLAQVKRQIDAKKILETDGVLPVIVTFHDPNTFTAHRLEEYLHILVDSANKLDMAVDAKPFYDSREEIEKAAIARSVKDAISIVKIAGFWTSLLHLEESH